MQMRSSMRPPWANHSSAWADSHLQLHRTRRHQKKDWASRGLCEKKRQALLVASRQSRVVRYPEARGPYRASPAKIALANNFQSDGEEDRAGQRHHHRHHHRRCLGLCLFVFISLLLRSMIFMVIVVAITIIPNVKLCQHCASQQVSEWWRGGGLGDRQGLATCLSSFHKYTNPWSVSIFIDLLAHRISVRPKDPRLAL